MNEMSANLMELLSGNATVEQVASQFEGVEFDLLAGITGSLGGSMSERERLLEEENRLLREALIREATLRAELLGRVRLGREPRSPRRRRKTARGVRHRRSPR